MLRHSKYFAESPSINSYYSTLDSLAGQGQSHVWSVSFISRGLQTSDYLWTDIRSSSAHVIKLGFIRNANRRILTKIFYIPLEHGNKNTQWIITKKKTFLTLDNKLLCNQVIKIESYKWKKNGEQDDDWVVHNIIK